MNWRQITTASIEEILEWAADQPWALAMAQCAQDDEWHAEGDVWTHTKMVCRELPNLADWECLPASARCILICTALFHDVAKPLTSTRDPATGRINSPKHAVKGEQVARRVLRDMDCDLKTREQISGLVRYHGRPAFLLERDEPAHEVARLSWLVNNQLLYAFALADTRGRNTESMSRPEENLHYWKATAEENDCYLKPYPFANQQARFLFFRQSEPNLYYVPHENYRCRATMLAGLPGSGKDTWLARQRPGLPVVSLDDVRKELGVAPQENQGRVVQLARERCREHLRSGVDFALNATNLLRQTRQKWIELFADYNARVEIVYVEPPYQKLLAQNRNRSDRVPEHVIKKLAEKYEPPNWSETHELRFVDGDSGGAI